MADPTPVVGDATSVWPSHALRGGNGGFFFLSYDWYMLIVEILDRRRRGKLPNHKNQPIFNIWVLLRFLLVFFGACPYSDNILYKRFSVLLYKMKL